MFVPAVCTLFAAGFFAGGVLNVRDYGAKGDGVTNGRAAIQVCTNAAAAAGKNVYFPAGTYYMVPSSGRCITMPSNVELRGAGDTSIIKGLDTKANDAIFDVSGKTNIKLTDLKLMGTNTDADAFLVLIHGVTVKNLTLTRCTFDMALNALNISGGSQNPYSENILVQDCRTLTGCLNVAYVQRCKGFEAYGGEHEVNRVGYPYMGQPDAWHPHHFYLSGYLEGVYIHDMVLTGGCHAAIYLGGNGPAENVLFKNIKMYEIGMGWSIMNSNNVVMDGITWVHDERLSDYCIWLTGDTTNFTLKNSTITGYGTYALATVECAPTDTNTIGPNVTMTNCAGWGDADGCWVGKGSTKPTIVQPVNVSK